MARRSSSPQVRAALQALSGRPTRLTIVQDRCPVCGAPLSQTFSGERRIVYHFSCTRCAYWFSVDRSEIQEAVEYAAVNREGAFSGRGPGWGCFDADTGEISLYCDDRRRADLLADLQEVTS